MQNKLITEKNLKIIVIQWSKLIYFNKQDINVGHEVTAY